MITKRRSSIHHNDLSDWLITRVLPRWLQYGWCRQSGFVEHLDRSNHCGLHEVRLRSVARQTYVFAVAEGIGVTGAKDAFEFGLEFLETIVSARPHLGSVWYNRTSGVALRNEIDLYDNAFVLLALAEIGKRDEFRDRCWSLASQLWASVESLRCPSGGFAEGIPPSLPRRQNPHMHLFEALIEAVNVFGDNVFREAIDDIARLALKRFYQHSEYLEENFTEDLEPYNSLQAFIEPGHHFEWASLIDMYLASLPEARSDAICVGLREMQRKLLQFAKKKGLTPDGLLVLNSVDQDGAVLDPTFRIWPNLERFRYERWNGIDTDLVSQGLSVFISKQDDFWIERLTLDRKPVEAPCPATTLYHLVTGILQRPPVILPAINRLQK